MAGSYQYNKTFDDFIAEGQRAVDQANKAFSALDFDKVGTSLTRSLHSVSSQLFKPRDVYSPYIVRESGVNLQSVGLGVGGFALTGMGMATLVAGVAFAAITLPLAVTIGVIGAGCAGGGIGMLAKSVQNRGLADELERISRAMGTRTSMALDDLARVVSIPAPKLAKSLKKAIERGFIPEGHVVEEAEENVLFLTDGSYRDYERFKREMQEREEREAVEAKADAKRVAQLPQETKDAIAACEAFVKRANVIAPSISDAKTRNSISDICGKIMRIATWLRSHPQDTSKLQELTGYYLPTTIKLVESFAQLDSIGATGESAAETRSEVNATLELLSTSLDKLLDEVLLDNAMDVASDARVMRTMLKQDGLA